jgi:hypothetical protein
MATNASLNSTTNGSSNSNSTNSTKNSSSDCRKPPSEFQDEPKRKVKESDIGLSTNVYGNMINATNAAGLVGTKNYSLGSPPWRMRSCDQVLQINAQTLKDMDDYALRQTAYFTMSIYMINIFNGKDNTKLVESVNVGSITDTPDIIKGTKNCLSFRDTKNDKQIAMCLSDSEEIEEIKDAFQKIMRCRMGDNLKELPIQVVKKIFEASCMGMTVNFDSQLAGTNNSFLASLNLRNKMAQQFDMMKAKVTSNNPWEIKYMTRVPGS